MTQHGRRWGCASLFVLVGWLLVSLHSREQVVDGRKGESVGGHLTRPREQGKANKGSEISEFDPMDALGDHCRRSIAKWPGGCGTKLSCGG
jgi:hypothetical protein